LVLITKSQTVTKITFSFGEFNTSLDLIYSNAYLILVIKTKTKIMTLLVCYLKMILVLALVK